MSTNTIVLIILFVAFLIFALKKFIYNYVIDIKNLRRVKRTGDIVAGKIVGFKEESDPDGRKLFLPLFEYVSDGKTIQKQSSMPQVTSPLVGEIIRVFLAKDSDKAYIDIEKQISSRIVGIIVVLLMLGFLAFLTVRSFSS